MTPNAVAERPIVDLSPEWIGLLMEVEDEGGTTIGFRLGRYEKTTASSAVLPPAWTLSRPCLKTSRTGLLPNWNPSSVPNPRSTTRTCSVRAGPVPRTASSS